MASKNPMLGLFVAGSFLLTSVAASADIVANYDFAGSAFASSDADTNSTAGAMTSVTSGTAAFTTFAIAGNNPGAAATSPTYFIRSDGTATTAEAADDYLQFNFSASSGFVANLSKISFDHAYTTPSVGPAVTYNSNWQVRYSFDGFASGVTGGTVLGTSSLTHASSTSTANSVSYTHFEIALGSISELQSIGATATITFRLYAFDNFESASSTSGVNRIDNVVLEGTVLSAVPEPSTYALLAGGLALSAVVARRNPRKL